MNQFSLQVRTLHKKVDQTYLNVLGMKLWLTNYKVVLKLCHLREDFIHKNLKTPKLQNCSVQTNSHTLNTTKKTPPVDIKNHQDSPKKHCRKAMVVRQPKKRWDRVVGRISPYAILIGVNIDLLCRCRSTWWLVSTTLLALAKPTYVDASCWRQQCCTQHPNQGIRIDDFC